MKARIYTEFGARNSAPVLAALAQGLRSHGVELVDHDRADVAVCWSLLWAGRMAGNRSVWQQYRDSGRSVITAEVGLKRGHSWRVMVNGHSVYMPDLTQDRGTMLGLELKPWRQSGSHIVIALQRPESLQWQGLPDLAAWATHCVTELRCHTDREIRVRPHPRSRTRLQIPGTQIMMPGRLSHSYDSFDWSDCLAGAWAVVNHNSNPGVEAIMAGIPAFVGHTSRAAAVSNLSLTQIETPRCPDRSAWFRHLCHSEWLESELAAGLGLDAVLTEINDPACHTAFCPTKA